MFSLFNFSSIFSRGSADTICPYVQTPMAQYTAQSKDRHTVTQVSVLLHRCMSRNATHNS